MIFKKSSSIVSFFFAIAVTWLPFNYIIGSYAAYFSYSSMAIPALGYQYSLLYVILYIFTKGLFSLTAPFLFLLHRLPLFFSTIALQNVTFWSYVALPLSMMFLFCIHPVGSMVICYSWYWLIPVAIYFFVQDSLLSRAVGASFIAHAIGSVVWLYTGSIPAHVWMGLVPLVMVERLLIALMMVGFVYCFAAIEDFFEQKVIA